MLANRLKIAILIIPIGIGFIVLGGWPYVGLISLMLGVSAWEYWRMFSRGGIFPVPWILIPGVVLLCIARALWGFEYSSLILSGLILVAMTAHIIRAEKGSNHPASDFSATISGLIYLGFIGSYLVSLRNLPGGMWWLLLAIPTVSIGDSGAFFIGRKFGRHPLAPVVSPQKTIEGYWGGVLFSILGGLALACLWGLRFPAIMPIHGLVLGIILGVLTPLGDLGESMLKRQFGVKDTGIIFSGHGGMMDRMDSWLWGAVISYYVVILFF